jgi:lysozyme family protein
VSATLAAEGGYVNNPKDPGGETRWGISKRAYPSVDIRALTRDDAIAIYYRDYWLPIQCDALPFAVAVVLFDIHVNGGHPVKWLQQALGITADEILGPATIAAANKFYDPGLLAARILRRRVLYYTTLGTFSTFGSDWVQRCFDIYRVALGETPRATA